LQQFRLWYSQAGTPEITMSEKFNLSNNTYELTFKQFCPPTPSQETKQPMYIPIKLGFLTENGKSIEVQQEKSQQDPKVIFLSKAEETFKFTNVSSKPVPSVFRDFSAPIKLKTSLNDEQLGFLLAYDQDNFNRWDAGQQLMERSILKLIDDPNQNAEQIGGLLLEALDNLLNDQDITPALKAHILLLPPLVHFINIVNRADPEAIYKARQGISQALSSKLKGKLRELYTSSQTPGQYSYNPTDSALRKLKNTCLYYLVALKDQETLNFAKEQYYNANNMTDCFASLAVLNNINCKEREELLEDFYAKRKHDPLVVNKWLALQASSELPNTFEVVEKLTRHKAFDVNNPNKVYALIGGFCAGNVLRFHNISGEGYDFLLKYILLLNESNPQVAARIINPFTKWRNFNSMRQDMIKARLVEIQNHQGLSKNIIEIVSKSLA